ncbi:MAG TPA: hypothetical protein V6D29_19210 [Leptolyngbyaceae cyanobacterium]
MSIPPSLRYWLIRLRALNRPLIWCSGLALVLLTLVFQEHRRHPEWLGQFEVDNNSPGQPGQNSTLSLDEQGSIADIDTLSALYGDPDLNPSFSDRPNAVNPDPVKPSENLLSLLQTPTPQGQPTPNSDAAGAGQSPGAPVSPFATYLEQYRFLGRAAQPAAPSTTGFQTPSLLASGVSPNGSGVIQAQTPAIVPPGLSPLQQALQQQYASSQRQEATQTTQPSTEGSVGTPSATGIPGAGSSSLPPAILPATLPGTNQTFLRTTPQMSPAPGTTGYVPPVTLSTQGSPYPSSVAPASGVAPNLSPISPSLGSNLGGIGSAGSSSSGSSGVLPPATGSLYSQPAAPAPEPSTVPRPAGSYTGGGYIYTFSDPNGPSR